MERKDLVCLNCEKNPSFKVPCAKLVEVTLELDENLNLSDCDLCCAIRNFLKGTKVTVKSLPSRG